MREILHASGAYAIAPDGVVHAKPGANAPASGEIAAQWAALPEREIPSLLHAVRASLDDDHKAALRAANIAITKEAMRASVAPDSHIIHASAAIEELDSVANRLSKRLRDWYALYYPELEREHRDHKAFVAAVLEYPRRNPASMGGEFSEEDLASALSQAQLLSTIYAQRELMLEYIERMMRLHAPNVTAVAGAMIGAQLIAIAGSLRRLASMPAGTVQLLGAETALFRHLRNRNARPPKHGVIFNHRLLQLAARERRGKVARTLADCISIAARVDYFKGGLVADALVAKVERSVKG